MSFGSPGVQAKLGAGPLGWSGDDQPRSANDQRGVELLDVAETIGVVSMATRVLPAIEAVTIARAADPVALAGGTDCRRPARFHRCVALRCDDCLRRPGWRAQVRDAACWPSLRGLDPLRVASVCTSALILGAASLLDGCGAATRRPSFAGVARPLPLDGGRRKRPAHLLPRAHLIETTARPLFPHPRHRTRSLRSSTLA